MAANDIAIMGAVYPDVPAVVLPVNGGGTALFTDVSDTTATAADVAQGTYFYTAAGVRTAGQASTGGGAIVITDTTDSHGGTIRTITAETVSLETKTGVNPSTSSQTISPGTGYTGLASVQINAMPTGTAGTPTATKGTVSNHSISVTPSVTNQTGYITGSTKTGTAVTVSASELVSGSETKTQNGTYDVTNLAELVVNVSGTSKNTQTVQSTSRRNNTSLGSIISLTCSTAGTYDVYWTCARSNTSQTWGSQLYIGGSAYGTENTTWSNNVQNNHLEDVSISANQTVEVYGRSRSGYYIHAPQLTIVQK